MVNSASSHSSLILAPQISGARLPIRPSETDAAQSDATEEWMRASLESLIRLIEAVNPGMWGSVLLLDDDGLTLRHGAAPNLPEQYCRLIDGEQIGPAAGSCGTAVFRRSRVVVSEIATDPLWAQYRSVAEAFGLAACWSTPVFDTDGNILGTFAMYYREPRVPTPEDISLTETATMLSANIIKRARIAQQLRLSHARLRAALDASATSTWEWNVRTDFVQSDEGLYRLFGIDPSEATGSFELFVSRIHPEDRQRVIDAARRSATEGVDLDEEFRIVRPDGSIRWVVDRGGVIPGENGRPEYVIGACVDITERREREEQFHALAESIPQLAWMADPSGAIYWFNERWYEYTGTTLEEMRGWGWKSVHHPDHLERVIERIQYSWDTGEPWEDTFPLRGRNGEYRWFLSRAQPIRDSDGGITRWFGTNTDITDRLEAEEAVRESEAKLRRIADSGIVGVFYWTLSGEITHANAEFLRMLGLREEDVRAGRVNWRSITPPEWEAVDAAMEAELLKTGATANWEKEYLTVNGERIPVVVGAALLQGSRDRGIAVCLDITERKQAELERERLLESERAARMEAERAIRLRDEVLAIVAHDLRNPVHSILLTASVLRDVQFDEAGRQHRLSVIQRTAKGMDHLIRDLLDATRIETGNFDVRRGRVHIPALLDETVEQFERLAAESEVSLSCTADAHLPPANGDRDRLAQVMSNLIGNALKFTSPGGKISVNARRAKGHIEISVADTGSGIPPEQLEHVFDRFWQADRQGRAGAGLGLAIAKGIVEAHEGRIHVQSLVGEGTTFFFTVPAARPDKPPPSRRV